GCAWETRDPRVFHLSDSDATDMRGGMAGTCPHLAYAVSGLESTRSGRYVRTTTEVEFHVLGPLEVIADGGFLPLGGAKQRAVLAILLLHANEVVGRDRL